MSGDQTGFLYAGINTVFGHIFSWMPTSRLPATKMNEDHHDKIDVSGKNSAHYNGEIDVGKTLPDQKVHAGFISGVAWGSGATWEPVFAHKHAHSVFVLCQN